MSINSKKRWICIFISMPWDQTQKPCTLQTKLVYLNHILFNFFLTAQDWMIKNISHHNKVRLFTTMLTLENPWLCFGDESKFKINSNAIRHILFQSTNIILIVIPEFGSYLWHLFQLNNRRTSHLLMPFNNIEIIWQHHICQRLSLAVPVLKFEEMPA